MSTRVTIGLLAVLLSALASTQVACSKKEAVSDHRLQTRKEDVTDSRAVAGEKSQTQKEAVTANRPVARDKSQIQRDAREIAEFEVLLMNLDDAREDRMVARYQNVNERVRIAMAREVDQARASARFAGMEQVAARTSALRSEVARGDRAAMEKNAALAHEFLGLMREGAPVTTATIGGDGREQKSDRP